MFEFYSLHHVSASPVIRLIFYVLFISLCSLGFITMGVTVLSLVGGVVVSCRDRCIYLILLIDLRIDYSCRCCLHHPSLCQEWSRTRIHVFRQISTTY